MSENAGVLLVDDEQEIHVITGLMLKKIDVEVYDAHSIAEAEQAVNDNKIDVILLDINLKNENGAAFISSLKKHENPSMGELPIVLISGYIDEDFVNKYQDKFAAILPKPFKEDELLKKLRPLLPTKEVIRRVPLSLTVINNDELAKLFEETKKNLPLESFLKGLDVKTLDDDFLSRRAILLMNIATGLAHKVGWSSETNIKNLICASLLHDGELIEKTHLAKIVDIEEAEQAGLDSLDLELYKEHPKKMAERIRGRPDISDDIALLVEHHHEKADGSGFPSGLDHKKLSPISCLFIIAHDLTHYILTSDNWDIGIYAKNAQMCFYGPNFKKVLKVLEN